ncbi:MAG TPA: nitroreductase/quinone reductase family protein [Mycobacterium sp.]|nr:nitroreductase/quinone reductase family protein [Mycobacterium sp.]HTX97641.1 nitroreductase/quinone reductase family protein [Mycobacterium sp.]
MLAAIPTRPGGSTCRENPHAVAQVNSDTFAVKAELAPVEQRPDLWRRLVDMYPYFTEYQQRTSREIPVVILATAATPGST